MGPWADRAVVIVHGIGVQQRGTTRDALMKALVAAGAKDSGHRGLPEPVAPGQPMPQLPRVARRGSATREDGQASMTRSDDADNREVDVYEVYWAPLLSGQTTPRAVLAWLLRATFLRGRDIRGASRKTIRDLVTLALWIGIAAFLTLVVISSVGNIVAQATCETDPRVECEQPLRQLTVDPTASVPQRAWLRLQSSMEVFVGSLSVVDRPLAQYSTARAAALLDRMTLFEWLTVLAIVFLSAQTLFRLAELLRAPPRDSQALILTAQLAVLLLLLLLPLSDPVSVALGWIFALTGVGLHYTRQFLTESLGDVQVYVNKDENSRHFAARENVIAAAEQVLGLVTDRRYREVVVLGHSLGSVVAYDALARLAERDPRRTQPLRALVTFGAAVEKVRYFFDRKARGNDERASAVSRSAKAVAEGVPWLNLWYASDLVANPMTVFPHPHGYRDIRWHAGVSVSELLREDRVVNVRFSSPRRPLSALTWSHSRYLADRRVGAMMADVVFADFPAPGRAVSMKASSATTGG